MGSGGQQVDLEDGTSEQPCRVGSVASSDANVVRIVHISDTHYGHEGRGHLIPAGDILIHSGDFLDSNMYQELETNAKDLDDFMSLLPHKHKVFVAGNHERCFNGKSREAIKALLPHVTYLQDEQVELLGVKIYGSPWNGDRGSLANAFVTPFSDMHKHWDLIPADTDILVTHNPPYKIFDNIGGMGCRQLRKAVMERVRPLAHLFGHAHDPGRVIHDGILFSNAACSLTIGNPTVIDVYLDRTKGSKLHGTKKCLLM